MTVAVDILSGLEHKAPAAILVTTPTLRLLLDAGGALDPRTPLWPVPEKIDAILLTHDHVDHIDGLSRLPPQTPIYCTAVTARSLPAGYNVHPIAVRGQFTLGDVTVTTGSSGHAWGGVWFHLNVAGGLFYSGDISMESILFHFDSPPPARVALVDASYGLYDTPQRQQWATLQSHFSTPALCPVPPSGRAVELALLLARDGRVEGIALDDPCLTALSLMAEHNDGSLRLPVQAGLRQLARRLSPFSRRAPLIFAADPDGQSGVAGALRREAGFHHRTLFTGHMNALARQQWQNGEVDFCRWNVHPTLSDLRALLATLTCRCVVPLFAPPEAAQQWSQSLACEVSLARRLLLTR